MKYAAYLIPILLLACHPSKPQREDYKLHAAKYWSFAYNEFYAQETASGLRGAQIDSAYPERSRYCQAITPINAPGFQECHYLVTGFDSERYEQYRKWADSLDDQNLSPEEIVRQRAGFALPESLYALIESPHWLYASGWKDESYRLQYVRMRK